MLRVVLAIALLQGPLFDPRFQRFESRNTPGRTDRGFMDDAPFFEAFGANGAGTFGTCSTTAPTGAKGEAITTVRASAATCTKGVDGTRSTAIADGDWVVMSNNQIRVETNEAGVQGPRSENAANQICLRTAELCNVAWTDLGTPNCASDQAAGPFGTVTMDSITDNDGAGFEGREQTIASTSATQFTAFCSVKWSSGAAASASIVLAGTGSAAGDCTGTKTSLSTTSSSIVECTSAAAYAGTLTAVKITIRVGTAAADQGVLLVEGCDVKPAAPKRTSHQPATGAAVPRSADTISAAPTWPTSASISMAASYIGPTPISGDASTVLEFNGLASILNESGGAWRWFSGGVPQSVALSSSVAGIRTYGYHDGAVRGLAWASTTGGPTADANAANKFGATLFIGGSAGNRPDGIITRVCVDPNPARCR